MNVLIKQLIKALVERALQALIEYARVHGIGELTALVLRENAVMLGPCRRLGFRAEPPMGQLDAASVHWVLR